VQFEKNCDATLRLVHVSAANNFKPWEIRDSVVALLRAKNGGLAQSELSSAF